MHDSVMRLLAFARAASNNSALSLAEVGSKLNVSSARMTNWKSRGISKDGAIEAERVLGCSVQWLLEGVGNERSSAAPVVGPSTLAIGAKVDFRQRVLTESQWSLLQDIEVLPEEERAQLATDLRERSAKYRAYAKEVEQRMRAGALGRRELAAAEPSPHYGEPRKQAAESTAPAPRNARAKRGGPKKPP